MKNRSLLLKVLSAVCSATMLCACIPFGASAEKANPSPNVIPAIREWEGGTGFSCCRWCYLDYYQER